MRKLTKNMTLIAAVVALFAISVNAAPMENYADQQEAPYSCLDAYGDPELNCFWDTGNGQNSCQNQYIQCTTACASQQVTEMNSCNRIQDPIQRADCLSNADLNAQMCQASCSNNLQFCR